MEYVGRRLPIDVRDFKEIRDGGYLYVDKTDMIVQIVTHKIYVQ